MAEVIDKPLYEADCYAWALEQAALLRDMAARRVESPLDLANLAEEVEDLGKGERDAVRSQVRRTIEHLLKLEFSPAAEPRGDWEGSVIDARDDIADKITPTLRRDIAAALPDLYERARRRAARGLTRFGEPETARALPATCPYTLEDILRDDWYPPNRHGLDGGGDARP